MLRKAAFLTAVSLASVPVLSYARTVTDRPVQPAIEVTGAGAVRVQADALHLEAEFKERGNAQAVYDAGTAEAALFRESGVPDAAWVMPVDARGDRYGGSIIGSVSNLNAHQAQDLILRLRKLPDPAGGALSEMAVFWYATLKNCTQRRDPAVRAALRDARSRAQRIARASGLHLGRIIAVADLNDDIGNHACENVDSHDGYSAPENIYAPVDVWLTARMTVTFAAR